MQQTIDKLKELKERYKHVRVADKSSVFNTDWLYTIELGFLLDVAESVITSYSIHYTKLYENSVQHSCRKQSSPPVVNVAE